MKWTKVAKESGARTDSPEQGTHWAHTGQTKSSILGKIGAGFKKQLSTHWLPALGYGGHPAQGAIVSIHADLKQEDSATQKSRG